MASDDKNISNYSPPIVSKGDLSSCESDSEDNGSDDEDPNKNPMSIAKI